METIKFNTGRRYTAEGQVIVATLHHDGVVTFMDHSRKIDGQFVCNYPELFDRQFVMQMYDAQEYQNTARSAQDGMDRGGCNTRGEE